MSSASDRFSRVDQALRSLRDERTPSGSIDLEALWRKSEVVRARRALRRRVLAPLVALATLALGGAGAYAATHPQWTAGVLRSLFRNITLVRNDGGEAVFRVDLIESPIDAAHGQRAGLEELTTQGLTAEEERADLLIGLGVGPGGALAEERAETGTRFVARDAAGAVTGAVALSDDGSTVTATGDSYIFINSHDQRLNPADVNRDSVVDAKDLLMVFSQWGAACEKSCEGDVDRDGVVGVNDLLEIVTALRTTVVR